jgi:hypothetical protein
MQEEDRMRKHRGTTRTAVAGLAVAAIAFAVAVAGSSAARLAAPTNSSPPTVSGTAQEGSTLTVNEGTWSGSPTFTYEWLRCDKDGGSCATISGANTKQYVLKTVDTANTLRARVTAKNADGSSSATTVPTAVVTAASTTTTTTTPSGNGCTSGTPSNQGGTVSVANVSLPARLLLDHFSVSPSVVHRSTSDVSVTVHVSNTCGQSVTGAMVYATAVPFDQFSVQPEQPTDANGNATITMHRQGGFPAARKQHLLVMMLRARKPGESVLGGISIRRLVSSRVDISL